MCCVRHAGCCKVGHASVMCGVYVACRVPGDVPCGSVCCAVCRVMCRGTEPCPGVCHAECWAPCAAPHGTVGRAICRALCAMCCAVSCRARRPRRACRMRCRVRCYGQTWPHRGILAVDHSHSHIAAPAASCVLSDAAVLAAIEFGQSAAALASLCLNLRA